MQILAKDLARQIGVSEATLSLVLNGKPGISKKTRARVEQMVRELGYEEMLKVPAPAAEQNTGGRTISFVLYKENGKLLGMNSFFPLILDGIEETVRAHGYSLNIVMIEHNQVEAQFDHLAQAGSSGVVLFATEMQEEMIAPFEALHIPIVLFDNEFLGRQIDCAKVNNRQGTFLAVQHLYEMGHRRIGYLSSGLNINSFHERQRCALEAMADFGLETPPEQVLTIGYGSEHAEEGMDALLEQTDASTLPTAFLADNDLVSIGAMKSLQQHGFRIPEDFSFVGYDDRPVCTMVIPKLTTIRLPRDRFGAEAVHLLIRQIEEQHSSHLTVEINGQLIERESVARIEQ